MPCGLSRIFIRATATLGGGFARLASHGRALIYNSASHLKA